MSRWLLGGWAALLLLVVTAAAGPAAVPAASGGFSAKALTTLFRQYGDTSGQWLGADRTASVRLPDGRTLWLFSDTFLGRPAADGSRPASAPLVHNSAIVQDGRTLGRTVHGGTEQAPYSLVPTDRDDEFHWVGDAAVSGGDVQVLVNRYGLTGTGPLDHKLLGTALATFDLPGLRAGRVEPLPLGNRVSWGSEVLPAGRHTYVYGTEAAGSMKFAHLARVAGTDLRRPWEFWTGSGWSARVTDSARVLSGVGTNYGVRRVGDRYVLVTHENNLMFSADFVAYTADSPTGPFDGPHYLFRAPETDAGHIVYDADLHTELARPGKLLISYNVNNLDERVAYADASIYRPRFVEVDWPPRTRSRKAPRPPSGLTAAAEGAGNAGLAWQPPPGDNPTYRVYRRDTTAGQTHFVRLPGDGPGAARTFRSDFLVNGHRYEFAVTAVNKHGESALSNVATMTATVPPPPAPTGVRAETDATGEVTARWSTIPFVQLFKVFHRDVTGGAERATPAGAFPGTSATIGPLRSGRTYDITVVAVGGGGESKPSPPARVRVRVAPPAAPPAAPTATARPDGTVDLTWPQVAPKLAYRVHSRDVTAGETRLGRPALATGTSYRARLLKHGHEYEFAVAALNDGGEGPLSERVRVRARVATPTAVPADLRAEIKDGLVELRWTSPERWHWVFRRDVTAGERTFTRDDIPVEGARSTLRGLRDGHEYELRVAAFSPGGVGPQSPPLTVTMPSAVPVDLWAVSTGPGAVRVTWRETRPGQSYRVQVRDVTAGESWRTDPYPVTGNRFDTVLLTAGHRYEFRVLTPAGDASAAASVTVS
ncbi:fibronectin type III domain-containing protein [Actinoplanes nipponensis]|uniref:Fibronectin type-III domain-containing protein n=1 Tax=Actinoplanes nipponensis TaxID=135950 RepID=A0A919JFK3_9ACTN|nr:fibronectin type III domain-containing protein [Actinoplanes nipponensis]GIE48617.1 hypothetical protein Ani05nite_21510 [Actinoplanes nipponensis]